MFFKFLPHDFNFFNLFEKQVDHAVEAARHFRVVVGGKGCVSEEAMTRIQDLEHRGDEAAHDIIEHLNKTFITPFDREDIYALTKELDNIVDMINTMMSRLKIYKIPGGDQHLIEFAAVIEQSVQAVASAVRGLRTMKKPEAALQSCVEVNRLENVGDAMRDKVLTELFDRAGDPILVIKWKEIYEDAETLLDICEDVAHVVESILVKQA